MRETCSRYRRRITLTRSRDNLPDVALPRRRAELFNQIAQRGLKQILDWEKALGQSSNRTLKRSLP